VLPLIEACRTAARNLRGADDRDVASLLAILAEAGGGLGSSFLVSLPSRWSEPADRAILLDAALSEIDALETTLCRPEPLPA
jgi:hypothetical protein